MTAKLRPLAKGGTENLRQACEAEARVRFIRARRALGLTHAELGARIGYSQDSLELWERGKVRIPAGALVAAEALASGRRVA